MNKTKCVSKFLTDAQLHTEIEKCESCEWEFPLNFIRRIIIIVVLFSSQLYSQSINPAVSSVINKVNIDSLTYYVKELSGGVPVYINNTQYTITSRHSSQPGNEIAAQYISQKLASFGLNPQFQDFNTTGRNVYALQQGTEYPGRMYIICAHYDAMPSGSVAPGADDNASGCAAVLEAARILSNYQTSYSVLYAFWDMEEQGLIGSTYYANQAYNRNDIILGVINLDMIGYDSNNDMVMDIHTRAIANSMQLSDTIVFVNNFYNVGLNPVVKNPGTTYSDHAPFWNKGYGAILLIESYPDDFNPFYHKVTDLLSAFNNTFFHRMSKLGIGTITQLAGASQPTYVAESVDYPAEISLSQNYPNPFNPSTTIEYRLTSEAFVTLEVFDILGRKITTLIDERQKAGTHAVVWNAEGFTSGTYIYKLQTEKFSKIKLMTLIK